MCTAKLASSIRPAATEHALTIAIASLRLPFRMLKRSKARKTPTHSSAAIGRCIRPAFADRRFQDAPVWRRPGRAGSMRPRRRARARRHRLSRRALFVFCIRRRTSQSAHASEDALPTAGEAFRRCAARGSFAGASAVATVSTVRRISCPFRCGCIGNDSVVSASASLAGKSPAR